LIRDKVTRTLSANLASCDGGADGRFDDDQMEQALERSEGSETAPGLHLRRSDPPERSVSRAARLGYCGVAEKKLNYSTFANLNASLRSCFGR
jgi:hypothetical protein